jgi:hypothetical protein
MTVQNGSLSIYNKVYKYDKQLKSLVAYYDIPASFDIETTSTYCDGEKFACVYLWCININGDTIEQGRTLEEFKDYLDKISKENQLSIYKRLIIYVHNLAFEFQFIRKYFNWHEVFATDERKPIKALTIRGIEFRDSLILSGYSLSNVAKICLNKTLEKEDYDYNLIRHSTTPLTDSELHYNIRDTEIVVEYIKQQIKQYNGIHKIPLTNTGRVRQYMKNYCLHSSTCHKKEAKSKYSVLIKNSPLTLEIYFMLKQAFQGGFTHANANKVGDKIENVHSYDIASSYPYCLISEKYPIGEWRQVDDKKEIKNLLISDDTALLFEIEFEEIQSKCMQEMYLSSSKCTCENHIENNGRIYYASRLQTTITEVDFNIIKKCYKWKNVKIGKCYKSYKSYLPSKFVKGVLELYQQKTLLKGVEGKEVEYMNVKGMLNSIYGMCVTDVVRDDIKYSDEWYTEEKNSESQLEKYNNNKKRFTCYQWGVWCTAYARRNLWYMIYNLKNDYIYSDTDSVKFSGEHSPLFDKYNKEVYNKLINICRYHKIPFDMVNPKQKLIGVYEYEGTYKHFKTLGAKRYMYIDKNNDLHITIAGLSKKQGKEYIENNGKFKFFNNNMYIPSVATGKQTHTYIDECKEFEVIDYLGNRHFEKCKSSIHLEECEFTLSISKQYSNFLQQLKTGALYKGELKTL